MDQGCPPKPTSLLLLRLGCPPDIEAFRSGGDSSTRSLPQEPALSPDVSSPSSLSDTVETSKRGETEYLQVRPALGH